jgi:hypothetical protein
VDGAQEIAARLRSYARELKDIVRLPENP